MIYKNAINQRLVSILIAIFVSTMFSFSANAASCKGMSKSACSASSSCNWVDGYKRKDGVKVSSHCRAASGKAKKETKAKKTESKKATKKTTSKDTKKKDLKKKASKKKDTKKKEVKKKATKKSTKKETKK